MPNNLEHNYYIYLDFHRHGRDSEFQGSPDTTPAAEIHFQPTTSCLKKDPKEVLKLGVTTMTMKI